MIFLFFSILIPAYTSGIKAILLRKALHVCFWALLGGVFGDRVKKGAGDIVGEGMGCQLDGASAGDGDWLNKGYREKEIEAALGSAEQRFKEKPAQVPELFDELPKSG